MLNDLAGDVAVGRSCPARNGNVCELRLRTSRRDRRHHRSDCSAPCLQAGALLDGPLGPDQDDRSSWSSDPFTMARGGFVPRRVCSTRRPKISDQYNTARIYDALNFDWMQDQTVLKHVTGSFSAGTVNGAGQTGQTLVTNAITGTLKKGDLITLAGSNAVNRITKQSTGQLRQFVVLADAANGATSLSLYPAIVPSSGGNAVQYQTVDNSPANGATIALVNKASETYRKNIAFAPQAVTMAMVDLYMPTKGVVDAARESFDGCSMRMITYYNGQTDQEATRLDVLYGYLWVRPEWACAIGDAL
jgi:hypothetical protein